MKKIYYILLICSMALGFTACHEDDEVVINTLRINATVEATSNSAHISCRPNLTGSQITYVALQYSTSSSFSYASSKIGMGKQGDEYVLNLTSLDPGTKYYVRFIVENVVTSQVSKDVVSFTTNQASSPRLSTVSVTGISDQSATFTCSITDNGGSDVYERGFYLWSTATSWVQHRITNTSADTFSATLSLEPNTYYEVYAYAKNYYGEGASSIVSFNTGESASLPEVVTYGTGNVTMYSAVMGGSVLSDGGSLVTEYGMCYSSTYELPTLDNSNRVAMGAGTGDFSQLVNGLQAGTSYCARAYAINNIGVAYGETIYFTTSYAPTVETYSADNVSTNSADISSYVSEATTTYGVCWSQYATPTIADNVIDYSTAGYGYFTSSLYDLQPGTTYYVRAFAVSDTDVTYGNIIQFTTLTADPVVQINDITDVSYYSATVNAEVISDGGQTIIERGVCYSTYSSPTVSDFKQTSGAGVGSYSCSLTGLSSYTTYYVRAYAATANGVVYGSTLSFTTY